MGKSEIEELAEDHATDRYWDIDNQGEEKIAIDRACGVEDFVAGARAVLEAAERILAEAEEEAEHLSGPLIGRRLMVRQLRALFEPQEPDAD